MKKSIRPKSHGNYLPCLKEAEVRLKNNECSCPKVLLFLSDGRPSDRPLKVSKSKTIKVKDRIIEHVKDMSRRNGKNLSISSIGIGNIDNFDILDDMSKAGENFGTKGTFQLPSMTTCNLGAAISSVASSLTMTLAELDVNGKKSQRILRSVSREPRLQASIKRHTQSVNMKEFDFYDAGTVCRRV